MLHFLHQRGDIVHVDFHAVSMDETIQAEVPLEPIGTPNGVKTFGGLLEQSLRAVAIECLPGDLPDRITVDVSQLNIGDSIHVRDIPFPSGVTAKVPADLTGFSVLAPVVEEEPAVAAAEAAAPGREVLLAKPMSFINRSGYPLLAVAQFYKIDPREVLVMLDDMALPLGRLRLRASGGSGGHNGLESIIIQFGTGEIPRLRIGIGEPPRAGSVDYVLSCFFEEEKPLVRSAIDRAVEAVKCVIDNGLVSAMNTFNKTEES